MISFIRGKLAELLDGRIVVEAGGVGYEISVPASVFDTLPRIGEEIKIYTYFKVSEDSVNLYGFSSRSDQNMFGMLLGVNGIGPRGALAIMSTVRPDDLRMAIISGDDRAIAASPGIGIKTAQRVILDLKDKIDISDVLGNSTASKTQNAAASGSMQEAIEALTGLGYSLSQATRAVRGIDGAADMETEDILRLALRNI